MIELLDNILDWVIGFFMGADIILVGVYAFIRLQQEFKRMKYGPPDTSVNMYYTGTFTENRGYRP